MTRPFLALAAALALAACTEPQTPAQKAPPAPAARASTPAPDQAKGPPMGGKVLKVMHAGGYTYMQVDPENGNPPFWAAASMLNVKRHARVRWADAAVMRNFPSKSMHRQFDEILFVSRASVVE